MYLPSLKIKLDQEISEKRNAEILKKYYLESLPLLQANFYTTLIEGHIHEEELEKYLSDYQISLSGPFFCCLVIHTSSSQVPKDINPLLLSASVEKQAKEYLGRKSGEQSAFLIWERRFCLLNWKKKMKSQS